MFRPKDVSAPDWSTKPVAAPAAFILRLTFDFQANSGALENTADGVAIGTGCVANPHRPPAAGRAD